MALFVSRATVADHTFTLDSSNYGHIVDIVTKLQGMPLAIELAAARTRLWPVGYLAQNLELQLPILTGGVHDGPSRHRTMRDTIAWSYKLLSREQQVVLRAMSIFPVGCLLETAVDLLGANQSFNEFDVSRTVSDLIDSSLIRAREDKNGEVRDHLLVAVREYCLEQVGKEVEEASLRLAAHRSWCVPLAHTAEFIIHLPDVKYWLNKIEAEYENVKQHIDWLIEQGFVEEALDTVASFEPYVRTRRSFGKSRELLERLLSLPDNHRESVARMKGLIQLGSTLQRQPYAGVDSVLDLFRAGSELSRKLKDERRLILALEGIGF